MENSGRIKKGQIKNAYGNLPIGDDLKQARRLTRLDFERICSKYMYMTLEEIQRNAGNKQVPVIEGIVISILVKALNEGDEKRLDFLLDRMIGQVVRKIKVTTEQEEVVRTVPIEMTAQEKLEMLNKMKLRIESEEAQPERTVIDVKPT